MDRLMFTKASDPLADRAFVKDYDRRLAGWSTPGLARYGLPGPTTQRRKRWTT
ncbi:hypothetical protein [Burkholderia gladioli]|uniref:hypothetical protein n=1 Tax=Burkholderia gladioli TaxID=28095 RepID=UPI0016403CB1|nr:hypothetical protein [Burkholderia gladioli]